MPVFKDASPQCTVWLFKTIDRSKNGASQRYAGSSPFIDLTPFLGDGASVRTVKSTRDPAGGFTINLVDRPQADWAIAGGQIAGVTLESLGHLIEPMDVIEIRMWRGLGPAPVGEYPIIMRGFVSQVSPSSAMASDGRPVRTVSISGQDWGKIWQLYQIIHFTFYAEGRPLLTAYKLYELFGVGVVNAMPAGEFVRTMIEKIINPHIQGFVPPTLNLGVAPTIQTGDTISVKRGEVNTSFHQAQGSVYDILKFHGDVGHWNELYIEDREDGIHCVYRAKPHLDLTTGRKIIEDAPDPIYCEIDISEVEAVARSRSDDGVVNFFWVENSRFDIISDTTRRQLSIQPDAASISLKGYPNADPKYYGTRPLHAATQQGDTGTENMTGGLPEKEQEDRTKKVLAWIDLRRKQLMDLNRDNVVFESGMLRVKGCPMRPDGVEAMKAGDYVRVTSGDLTWDAYVSHLSHDFVPYQGYTTTLNFERGDGFFKRSKVEGSPWLLEQTAQVPS